MKSLAQLKHLNTQLKALKYKAEKHANFNEAMQRVELEKENKQLLSVLSEGVKTLDINHFHKRDLTSSLNELKSEMSDLSF